jgi:hypothetical protein
MGDGVDVDKSLQNVDLREQPAPPGGLLPGASGIGREGVAAIIPEDKRIGFYFVPNPTVQVTSSLESFIERLSSGLGDASAEALEDDRIALAVDAFSHSYFEGSPFGQFMSRIAVLEVLKEQKPLPNPILELIAETQTRAAEMRREGVVDGRVTESVIGGLERLKKQSIGQAIYDLVEKSLDSDQAREAKRLYGIRHDIVHEGKVVYEEIRRNLTTLTNLVRDLLRDRIRNDSAESD